MRNLIIAAAIACFFFYGNKAQKRRTRKGFNRSRTYRRFARRQRIKKRFRQAGKMYGYYRSARKSRRSFRRRGGRVRYPRY